MARLGRGQPTNVWIVRGTPASQISVALGIASETDTAGDFALVKGVNIATETDEAIALGRTKTLAIGIASEADTAEAFGRIKTRALGIATETDTAGDFALVKGVNIASETDSAQTIGRSKVKPIGTTASFPTMRDTAVTGSDSGSGPFSLARPAGTRTGDLVLYWMFYEAASGQPIVGAPTGVGAVVVDQNSSQGPFGATLVALLADADGAGSDTVTPNMSLTSFLYVAMSIQDHAYSTPSALYAVMIDRPTASGSASHLTDTLTTRHPRMWLQFIGADNTVTGGTGSAGYTLTADATDGINHVRVAQQESTLEDPDESSWTLASGVHVRAVMAIDLSMAREVDTANTERRQMTLARASETDTAIAFGRIKTRTLGIASETDTAEPITEESGITEAINTAEETDTAGAFGRIKTRALGVADETDTAGDFGVVKSIGIASETDTAIAFGRVKTRSIGTASETDTAEALNETKIRALGIASETDTAGTFGRIKTRAIGIAPETDTAEAFGKAKVKSIGIASETDTAEALTETKILTVGIASETDTAGAFGRIKTRFIGFADEIDTGGSVGQSGVGGAGQETDSAMPIGRVKVKSIGIASEADSAEAFGLLVGYAVGTASETDTAEAFGRIKTRTIGIALETDEAQAIGRIKVASIGFAEEIDSAGTSGRTKTRALGMALEIDTAIRIFSPISLAIGTAFETDIALPIGLLQGDFGTEVGPLVLHWGGVPRSIFYAAEEKGLVHVPALRALRSEQWQL